MAKIGEKLWKNERFKGWGGLNPGGCFMGWGSLFFFHNWCWREYFFVDNPV
jgi:hypothetical protein